MVGTNNADFYWLNCLYSSRTKGDLKSHEKVCKNKDFCGIVLPTPKNILEFNQYMKSDKVLYIIYVNIKSLMKKMDRYANNPEKSSTTKIDKYIPCEYSMSNIWVIDDIENKNSVKVLQISKRTWSRKYNWFWKDKNVTVNKKITKITLRCCRMLHLYKKNKKVY